MASPLGYLWGVMHRYPHPDTDRIELASVLEALADPTRLAVVAFLASLEGETLEAPCGAFTCFGSKSNLTYHLARLREAGITRTRVAGTSRLISLRRDDLEQRFPGLLATIIASALAEPERAATMRAAQAEFAAMRGAAV